MKPIIRRSVIASLAALAVTFGLLLPTAASAQSDPLPSWNDGPAKQAIVNFVKATTESNPDFVPPEERIATFDQDGTLWVAPETLVLHDDPTREYAYGPAEGLPDTKVDTFTQDQEGRVDRDQHKETTGKRIFGFDSAP